MIFRNKNLFLLADAVCWIDESGMENYFQENSVLMGVPCKKKLLFAGPGLRYKGQSKTVSTSYYEFTGRKNRHSYVIDFPTDLDFLGFAKGIAYKSDKHHGGGDGTWAEYQHEFDNETKVYCRGAFFVFVNPKMKITTHGIEN